ncbi:amino acid transporter [Aspergillus steynii IBT 23096]|uniref:Amino acid transporter n=1 Tax=Aspergillus steynii IBT 23096 TaxID=1392250 RepID=A0A2I2FUS7_9EURO|nr:amino acid transporter [Aspergillus steynii IBT 23096]PLB44399.1 amino acid transporter [Aspergillus steynii IBT 23096]
MAESPQPEKRAADSNLESLGYIPELSRNRSTWQVIFMCFILASVPYGLSTTMMYTMAGGGSANMVWGWVAVSLIMLCVAGSLAEITSVYPTAGGVYYQTFALSPTWCRRVTAWVCGWSYIAGNITITLAVNFATALFLVESLNVFKTDGVGITENFETYQSYLIFLGITLLCHAISAFGNRWLTHLETLAIFWTLGGVVAIIVTILVVAAHGRRSAEWVFTSFEPQSGWPDGWSFCIGLLQAAYGLSASGMVTSMCEEVHKPAIQVPKAIVGGVALNFFAGICFLIPICFVLPDIPLLANLVSGQPVPTIFLSATGNSAGAFCLLIPLILLGITCGVGCVTAASRCTWAFARDGAIPGSKLFRKVNKNLDIPLNAMMLGMVIEILLGLIYFGSTAAFNAFSGVGVIFLTMSYGCPVAVSLILRRREDIKRAHFNLGGLGIFCNIVCIAWTLLAIPLFSMPTTIPVTLESMNYASVVFVGFVAISAFWYWIWGYRNYAGPPTTETDFNFDFPSESHVREKAN